jgi:hypothetical protein
MEAMAHMGVVPDEAANAAASAGRISAPGSKVEVHVIPANEELMVVDEAYRYIVETLKHKYIGKPLIICTLPPSLYTGDSPAAAAYINNDTSITIKQKFGKSKSFISDTIKAIGGLYGCFVIDLLNCGISPFTSEQASYYYNNGDGVHPNQAHGGVVLGDYIADYLKNKIYVYP